MQSSPGRVPQSLGTQQRPRAAPTPPCHMHPPSVLWEPGPGVASEVSGRPLGSSRQLWVQRQDGNSVAGPHKPATALLSVLHVE